MSLKINNEIVSIITPVFNGEKFIDKCFACINKQKYTNIEWIIINDGSEDGSLAKLNKLKKEYVYLNIIDQNNTGAAEARRAGAMQAKGDYIVYLDIDDSISEDAIELAMAKFMPEVDVVLFTQIKVSSGESVPFQMYTQEWPQLGDDVFKACIDGWGAHSKGIYRKEIFLSAYSVLVVCHTLSKTYKDEFLTRVIFLKSSTVNYCKGKYYYDLNDSSVSKKFNSEYYLIANNAIALTQYLTLSGKDINIERLYSRLFFDILVRYLKWRVKLENKKEWQSSLFKLAKNISIKKDFSRSIEKSDFNKMLPRIIFILVYKAISLVRNKND